MDHAYTLYLFTERGIMKKRVLILPIVALLMGFSVGGAQLNLQNKSYVKDVLRAAETGTINFGSADGSTNVNSASVTGNDSKGNEWTVTTVGTTSFTPNADYAQVGASKKPATSITFTTTLADQVNFTAFSAKFGGFNGTAGTVTLKVGDTTVGTGSLNESSDVTVSSSSSAIGTVLTATVTGISKGVKCYRISYTYEAVTEYTVTFESNGGTECDAAKVAGGHTATSLPSPTKDNDTKNQKRYEFAGWYTDNTKFENAFTTSTVVNDDITVYAKWNEIQYYVVTFNSNGGSDVDAQNVDSGQTATTPTAPTYPDDESYAYTFEGWYTDNETFLSSFDFSTAITGNIILYAKYNREAKSAYYKSVFEAENTKASLSYRYETNFDTLTRATTGVLGTNYTDWSKTTTSSAAYAGNSAGGNDSIQLRTDKSNSGIVTTTSGGTATKVTVSWNTNTASGRSIDIYGSNTAYTDATDLYSTSTQGTKIGTITKGDTELTLTGNYAYIGIRSSSGALYLTSITIQWGETKYDITSAGIRFGGLITNSLYTNLGVEGYGVMVGTTARVESVDGEATEVTTLKEAFEYEYLNGTYDNYEQAIAAMATKYKIANVYATTTPQVTDSTGIAKSGDYYIWNAYVNIPSSTYFNTSISAVAYIKVDGEYIFMQEKKITLVQLANDYLTIPEYQNNYKDGSLAYLASL